MSRLDLSGVPYAFLDEIRWWHRQMHLLVVLQQTELKAGRNAAAQRFSDDSRTHRTQRNAGLKLMVHLLDRKPLGWTYSLMYQHVERELARRDKQRSSTQPQQDQRNKEV
jgi:hypothetical protein